VAFGSGSSQRYRICRSGSRYVAAVSWRLKARRQDGQAGCGIRVLYVARKGDSSQQNSFVASGVSPFPCDETTDSRGVNPQGSAGPRSLPCWQGILLNSAGPGAAFLRYGPAPPPGRTPRKRGRGRGLAEPEDAWWVENRKERSSCHACVASSPVSPLVSVALPPPYHSPTNGKELERETRGMETASHVVGGAAA
jgi:hypothetical protein